MASIPINFHRIKISWGSHRRIRWATCLRRTRFREAGSERSARLHQPHYGEANALTGPRREFSTSRRDRSDVSVGVPTDRSSICAR